MHTLDSIIYLKYLEKIIKSLSAASSLPIIKIEIESSKLYNYI